MTEAQDRAARTGRQPEGRLIRMAGSEAWDGDWEARLYARVRARGHDSVLEFAYARPTVSVIRLAEELGPNDVAGIQVERTMIAEASRAGETERLVRDLLTRALDDVIGAGWPRILDDRARFQISGALARWSASLPKEWRPRALRASRLLLTQPPRAGWKPAGADDAIVAAVLSGGSVV